MTILLQASTGNSGMMSILMLVALFAVMYFFMIRPQQKKQKEVQKMRDALKVGDKVLTAGGIYGKIKEIDNASFLIEIADGVRVRVEKSSVYAAGNES
ncbi:MAG: preprotein translocase subunit YajC [Dysgonamonadaceae bacterium]|jgi:preprotein translocase subunit YajC|nr:preprotein translocase subunit YajC [Dysgonamonadaceae bacterium]